MVLDGETSYSVPFLNKSDLKEYDNFFISKKDKILDINILT